MSLFQSILLGIVQGLTEYLPISSTAHLRIVPALLDWKDPGAAFSAVIQLGTLGSVLLYYARDLCKLGAGSLRDLRSPAHWGPDLRMSTAIVAGTVPIGVLGLLFKDAIETDLRSLSVIATSLIVLALLLAWAERAGKRTLAAQDLGFWQIQLIGLAQAVALIPGASRSGTTITAELFLGMKREEAARFSFLLSIPAVAAAGLFELKDLLETPVGTDMIPALIAGTLAAFLSGLLAIDVLIRFLKTRSTLVFIVYRILLGISILIALGSGMMPQ